MAYQLVNLQEHATFASIQAMDNTVRKYNAKISKTHYETLNLLKQYSCKVIGVSHLKIKTIAKKLNKSIATIKRHIKYLKVNGFISVINTVRTKQGGKGANTYAINPFKLYEKLQNKIKNELSQMSYRNLDRKRNQYQSQQALAYVQVKKETISILKLSKHYVSNKVSKKQIRMKRSENIKYFRACPEGVPQDLYELYRPYFSDAQIKTLYERINDHINHFTNINDQEYTEITYQALNSLIKALRNSHRGKSSPVRNIFAYASGTAKKIAFKISHINIWDEMSKNYEKSIQPENKFKAARMYMWEQAGLIDNESITY